MAQYVIQNGLKYVQLDDNSLAPVFVGLSLEGGTLVKLTTDQLSSLRNPVWPTQFPIPASQVTDLKQVTIQNFPSAFQVSNFPSAFQVSNLPATYPLSSDQATNLASINTNLNSFTRGSGTFDANTLRVVNATNQPVRTTTMTPISLSNITGDQTILTPSSGKALRIANLVLMGGATNSLIAFYLKQGTVAQGQTDLSGLLQLFEFAGDFPFPIALATDRSFVINFPAITYPSVTGYVTWWEE